MKYFAISFQLVINERLLNRVFIYNRCMQGGYFPQDKLNVFGAA
jgi:hypothetical protein